MRWKLFQINFNELFIGGIVVKIIKTFLYGDMFRIFTDFFASKTKYKNIGSKVKEKKLF